MITPEDARLAERIDTHGYDVLPDDMLRCGDCGAVIEMRDAIKHAWECGGR